MAIIKNSITFGSGFNITAEGPIDSRMVVEYISDLTTVWNPDAPAYEGMIVSVLEDGNIYTLRNKKFGDINNWKKIGSDGDGDSDSDSGSSGIGKYSLPVMTEEMKNAALADPESGFNKDSSYISVDDGSSLSGETTNNTITSVNGTYLYIMMNTIRALQAEVAKLKNTFQYGIHSYNNEVTAKSSVLDQYDETLMDEPLWALDPYMMSEVFDTVDFKTELLPDNFTISSTIGGESIDASIPNQLTFKNGIGKFSDKANTLLNITDSKLVTYLVTNSKHIYFNLHTKDDVSHKRRVDIASFIEGDYKKYGVMFVLSRKVGEYGKNYVYVSVMNYDTNEKIVEGYLTEADKLSFRTGGGTTVYEVAYKYSIESIDFVEQTLYRMKFYTKYEDFSEEVIPSAPEEDYTYKAAHLTIRSVKNSAMMEKIKEQLHENELIWNEDKKELNIKSNNKIYKIGIVGSNNNTNTEEAMTPKELIEKLTQMGIIVNAQTDSDGNIISVENLKLNDISEFSLINSDTEKKYTFTVDPHGNLVGKDVSMKTIESDLIKVFEGATDEEKIVAMNNFLNVVDDDNANQEYGWIRGFIPLYLKSLQGKDKWAPNGTSDYGLFSDRLRISSFYAPLVTDTVHGCSHSFIELENTSDVDIPLEGVYLHFYRPLIDGDEKNSNKVYHLALDGVIKSGSTYLIRGAQHADMDDASTFIKVDSYDKEWYYKTTDDEGNVKCGLVSFEQGVVATKKNVGSDGKSGAVEDTENNKVHGAYKFCLTYGLEDLDKDAELIVSNRLATIYITSEGQIVNSDYTGNKNAFQKSDFPNIIKNRRYIDGCGFSSFAGFAGPGTYDKECKKGEEILCKGRWFCGGVTITENTMFRHMFALDPAKQAYNGWTIKDGSRTRYNKATDLQVVSLSKEFIGFPNSEEVVPISRYTPKASYENKNVMTDKSQLDREKPNMVTCSFGIDVYKTRCFNWISCGAFDEYLWVRKQGDIKWKSFASYTKTDSQIEQKSGDIVRREFIPSVNNAVYARMTSRFPGNNVLFTSHKVIIDLTPLGENDTPVVYEYVVGRADKNGNPDTNHTNEIYTFTLYPSSYEGRTYQITDQQGFHWIEYQVWAAAAEKLNKVIEEECKSINDDIDLLKEGVKVFPILINTGDMTQSGARINEWLDYYNGGKCMFTHMEQMNCVGNNDLCNIDPTILGTGNDPGKSNAKFFHYFYCYEIPNDERLIVKAHDVNINTVESPTILSIPEDRYIPSTYYFKTRGVIYVVANSEITKTTCEKWFGLYDKDDHDDVIQSINLYTGIEIRANGNYNNTCQNKDRVFYPVYETIYSWLNENKTNGGNKKIVFVCHEIPFTVITQASLLNKNRDTMLNTRNYPNGTSSLLGSHMNQLDSTENRGTYWISRLLEYFGCKLCIGGHKHTYALSYPIKENYQWVNNNVTYNSLDSRKEMEQTLEDESGSKPKNEISWVVTTKYDSNNNPYNVGSDLDGNVSISSTKLPYIPSDLYSMIGENKFNNNNFYYYRCCTPVDTSNNKHYDGFVNYSMCQATGYKLKSNKELPCAYQVFSKLIPMTKNEVKNDGGKITFKDTANGNQLYPMFSVLEFEHNNDNSDSDNNDAISAINVKLCRIAGIFKEDGKDSFTQTSYGTNEPSIYYLIEVNDNNVKTIEKVLNENVIDESKRTNIEKSNYMYGVWISKDNYNRSELNGINKYLYIQY